MKRALPGRAAAVAFVVLGAAAPAAGKDKASDAAQVDIQFSLCAPPAQVESALALRPRGAAFDVWLFDDPALALFGKGLRIRLRDTGRGAELTLKVADQDCAKLPAGALAAGEGKCEYDLHGEKLAGALSLTRSVDRPAANELVTGRRPLASALSAAQVHYLQGVPGAWPLPAGLRTLGPTRVRSYRAEGKPYVVDVSELPGGERFIEISRKVGLADLQRQRDRLESDLAQAGVAVCGDQTAQAVSKLRALLRRP